MSTADQIRRIYDSLNDRLKISPIHFPADAIPGFDRALRELSLDIYQGIADAVANNIETGVVSFLGSPMPATKQDREKRSA